MAERVGPKLRPTKNAWLSAVHPMQLKENPIIILKYKKIKGKSELSHKYET